jgi:hypothetical protein
MVEGMRSTSALSYQYALIFAVVGSKEEVVVD